MGHGVRAGCVQGRCRVHAGCVQEDYMVVMQVAQLAGQLLVVRELVFLLCEHVLVLRNRADGGVRGTDEGGTCREEERGRSRMKMKM